MPAYTVSQPKGGFPNIYQHGLPWLALEYPEKARAIAEAMNRADVEPAAAVNATLGAVDPQVRLTQIETTVAALASRVLTLESQRRPSHWRSGSIF